MGKGPALYTEIGKKTTDLLYKDYLTDRRFTISAFSPSGVAFTYTGVKKGDLFSADVNTQLKDKNLTADVKVDMDSNLSTAAITLDETVPGLKTIFSFKCPDERSGKDLRTAVVMHVHQFEAQYLHDYAAISTSIGLTANPVVNFSGNFGNNVLSLGTDVAFDSKSWNFTRYNAGLSCSYEGLIAALTLNDKGDTVTASYYNIVNPDSQYGAEVTHRFSKNEITVTVGFQYRLDPLTSLKGRINNYGKLSGLIQHEWRPKSFFTISGEVDTKGIEKRAKVGLALALGIH